MSASAPIFINGTMAPVITNKGPIASVKPMYPSFASHTA